MLDCICWSFGKKAILFFMPNHLNQWNSTSLRRWGEQFDQMCEEEGGHQLNKVLHHIVVAWWQNKNFAWRYGGNNNIIWRLGVPPLVNYQFHLIAWIDDATQILLDHHVQVHNSFSNVLKTKLNWSKNVTERAQCIVANNDGIYGRKCLRSFYWTMAWNQFVQDYKCYFVIALYVWSFTYDLSIPSGGQKGKVLVQMLLQKIFRLEEFTSSADDGNNTCQLGSHSIHKIATTHTPKRGCTCNEKDICSQWKSWKCVSDV
jgi:hypothetical protein